MTLIDPRGDSWMFRCCVRKESEEKLDLYPLLGISHIILEVYIIMPTGKIFRSRATHF